uniref:hypothetical protein n=1 Tax=Salmonella sp. s58078 TaxID=3159699 RepID=UPI003981178D
MDIEEWEILPDDGFLEIHDDGSGNKIFSRKYASHLNKHVFQMNNYFNISPRSSHRLRFDPPPDKSNENPRLVVPN